MPSCSQPHEPRCLPLHIMNLLSSDSQREWWDAVYSLIHKRALPEMTAKLHLVIEHGLSTLRAGKKHGLQPALLIHWAKHLFDVAERVNSYYDQKDYAGRSVHYWKVVLPLLEKIRHKRSIPEPLHPLFMHFQSRDIQPSQVRVYEEDADISFAILLDIEGNTEEAIVKLEKLNSMSSNWHLAKIYQRLSEEAGNGLEETQGRCNNFFKKFKKCLTKIYQANGEDVEALPVSMEEVMELLNEVNQQLEDIGDVDEDQVVYPLTSSPSQPVEGHVKFSTPSPFKSVTSPSKTPPHWVEDQKSMLQMLCEQVEALKNEVRDLSRNSSDGTASSYRRYQDNYAAEGLQETFLLTGPSVCYNQSTPTSMYPEEQVFGPRICFESPATSLLSEYSEEYYSHNIPQPTVNPEPTPTEGVAAPNTSATTWEDGPNFEPIVPLPDKVDVKTGEEEEEEMFCKRAKLFRFDSETKECKEKGIGSIASTDVSSKGFMVGLEDAEVMFAGFGAQAEKKTIQAEAPQQEKVSATPAVPFGTGFDKEEGQWDCDTCLVRNDASATECVSCKAPCSIEKCKAASQGGLAAMLYKKDEEWDCDTCLLRNKGSSSHCVSCQTANPNMKNKTSAAPVSESEAKSSDRHSQRGSASDLKNIAELHKEKDKEAAPSSSDQPVNADSHNNSPLSTGNTLSFADLAKSQGSFQFGQKDPNFKGFPGAGEQLFTGLHSSPKADTTVKQDDKMYKTKENGNNHSNTDMPPSDLVEVSAEEENEEIHSSRQAKLNCNNQDFFQTPGANLGTQSTKNVVSPPKNVFGSESVQKIFGSPSPSKEKSPDMISSSKDEETAVSRLKTSGPAVTSQSSVGTPFSILTSGLSLRFASSEVVSFAELAKGSPEFAFGKKDDNFTWPGAGAPVFGSTGEQNEGEKTSNEGEEERSNDETPTSS